MNNEIKQFIEDYPIDNISGLNTISFGRKETNGKETSEIVVVFGVEQKKPLKDLAPDQIIPGEIVIDGEEIKTDIVEDISEWEYEADCYTQSGHWPIDTHRSKHLPLKGGVSIGSYTYDAKHKSRKVGTLGAIVVDNTDSQLVGLSNNHVLTPQKFTTADKQKDSYNFKDDEIMQPAAEITVSNPAKNKIGTIKRVYPLSKASTSNKIDAALFNINPDISNIIDTSSAQQVNLFNPDGSPVVMVTFASTTEIDSILKDNVQLFKSGRTTGPIGVPGYTLGNTSCGLSADRMNYRVRISGHRYINLIRYTGTADPSKGGDSGSLVCGYFNGDWKAVGLHMAGARIRGTDYAVMCRIDEVAELLNIRHYDPDKDALSYGQSQPVYRVIEGYSDDMYVIIDNKTYWQVGRTNHAANTEQDPVMSEQYRSLPE